MSKQLELNSIRFRREYASNLLKLADMLAPFVQLHPYELALRNLVRDMDNPFRIAVFGYMKRGKSSIINALVEKKLTITGTEETTATVNHLTHGTGSACNEFSVYWKNSQPKRYPLSQLCEWCGKDDSVKEMVAGVNHLEFYTDAPIISQMNIIDTPGIGATADFHESVAQQFLCGGNTDALVYVFGQVGREEDIQALETFHKMSLQGYETYNCVGVMHLWDTLYWDQAIGNSAAAAFEKIKEHAAKLRKQFAGRLLDVVPVSAPLGLLAAVAPARFWENVLSIISSYDSVETFLQILGKTELRWQRQAPALYELYLSAQETELPLPSFRMMLHYLYENKPESAEKAAALIAQLSGIPHLRELLDSSFFKRRAIISLRQIRNKVQTLLTEVYNALSDIIITHENEIRQFEAVAQELSSPDLRMFIDKYTAQSKDNHLRSQEALYAIDTLRYDIADRVQLMDDALYVTHDWQNRSRWIQDEAQLSMIDLCASFILTDTKPSPHVNMKELLDIAGWLDSAPDRFARACADKLRNIYAHLMQ